MIIAKNFAFLMSQNVQWKLAPAYDVTFCEGPGGYHQMDIMGEVLDITRLSLSNWALRKQIFLLKKSMKLLARFVRLQADSLGLLMIYYLDKFKQRLSK